MSAFRLSETQKSALSGVEWLVAEGQDATGTLVYQSGRTTVLALAFIRNALRNPDIPQKLFDHYRQVRWDQMATVVEHWLRRFELLPYARLTEDTLRFVQPEPKTLEWKTYHLARSIVLAL